MQTEKGASLVQIKALNRRQLRRAIYRQGPVARNRLARELGVSLPTVTTSVAAMLEEGLLTETPDEAAPGSLGGRPAMLVDFRPEAGFAVGVELGPYGTHACLTDLRGTVRCQTQGPPPPADYNQMLADAYHTALSSDAVYVSGDTLVLPATQQTDHLFSHNVQSLRVVDVLEKEGRGLNLTFEVRDGILNHKKSGHPATLEGRAVSVADRIAYVNHDIEDAIRAGLLREDELPEEDVAVLGATSRDRINTMISSIYENSAGENRVVMGEKEAAALEHLRSFMFEKVYITPLSRREEERAKRMLSAMYDYFIGHRDKLPRFYRGLAEQFSPEQAVCDYLSSMTDKFAVAVFNNLFVPRSWALAQSDVEED